MTPRFPVLKSIAAVTVFAFTVTTLLPAGWAWAAPARDTMRVQEAVESAQTHGGLEEALTDKEIEARMQVVEQRHAAAKVARPHRSLWERAVSPMQRMTATWAIALQLLGIRSLTIPAQGAGPASTSLPPARLVAPPAPAASPSPQAVVVGQAQPVALPPSGLSAGQLPARLLASQPYTWATNVTTPPQVVLVPPTQFRPAMSARVMDGFRRGWAAVLRGATDEWPRRLGFRGPPAWTAPSVGTNQLSLIVWDPWNLELAGPARLQAFWNGMGKTSGRILYGTGGAVNGEGYASYDGMKAVAREVGRHIALAHHPKVNAKISPLMGEPSWALRSGWGNGWLHLAVARWSYPGFDWDRAYVDVEVWTTPEWEEALRDARQRDDQTRLKTLAWDWYQWHQEVVHRLPGTSVYTFVQAAEGQADDPWRFPAVMAAALKDHGVVWNERLVPVTMAYASTPQAVARMVQATRQTLGVPVQAMALNLQPEADPRQTLHDEFARNPASIVPQGVAGAEVVLHLRDARAALTLGAPARVEGRWAPSLRGPEIQRRLSDFLRFMVGERLSPRMDDVHKLSRPKTGVERTGEFFRSLWQGQAGGVVGAGTVYRAGKMLTENMEGRWRVEIDAIPSSMEGILLKPARQIQGFVASAGDIRVTKVEFLDAKGQPLSQDVLGTRASLYLPSAEVPVRLKVTIQRDPSIPWWWQWRGLNASVAARVGQGHWASGALVQSEEWTRIHIPPFQREGTTIIPLPPLVEGVNVLNVKLFGVEGDVMEQVGAGRDPAVIARGWPYLVRQAQRQLEARAAAAGPAATDAFWADVRRLNQIGIVAGGQVDAVVRAALADAEDPTLWQRTLEALRAGGVTTIALAVPDLTPQMAAWMTPAPAGPSLSPWLTQPVLQRLQEAIVTAHQQGLRVSLRLDGTWLKPRHQAAPERLAELLRQVAMVSEREGVGWDGFVLDEPSGDVEFRMAVERAVADQLWLPLLVAGPPSPTTPHSLQAQEIPLQETNSVTTVVQTLQELVDRTPSDRAVAGHRWPAAVLRGNSLSTTIAWLERQPTLGRDPGGVVRTALLERVRVPSKAALLRQGLSPEQATEAQPFARAVTQPALEQILDHPKDPQHALATAVVGAWSDQLDQIESVPQRPRFLSGVERFVETVVAGNRPLPILQAGQGFAEVDVPMPPVRTVMTNQPVPVTVHLTHRGSSPIGLYLVTFSAYHETTQRREDQPVLVQLLRNQTVHLQRELPGMPPGRARYWVTALPWMLETAPAGLPGSLLPEERMLSRSEDGTLQVTGGPQEPSGTPAVTQDEVNASLAAYLQHEAGRQRLEAIKGGTSYGGLPMNDPQYRLELQQRLARHFASWAAVQSVSTDPQGGVVVNIHPAPSVGAATPPAMVATGDDPMTLITPQPVPKATPYLVRFWLAVVNVAIVYIGALLATWLGRGVRDGWRALTRRRPPPAAGLEETDRGPAASRAMRLNEVNVIKPVGPRQVERETLASRETKYEALVAAGTQFSIPTQAAAQISQTMQPREQPPWPNAPPNDAAELATYAQEAVGYTLASSSKPHQGRMTAQIKLGTDFGRQQGLTWLEAVLKTIRAIHAPSDEGDDIMVTIEGNRQPLSGAAAALSLAHTNARFAATWVTVEFGLPPRPSRDDWAQVKRLRRLIGEAFIQWDPGTSPGTSRILVDQRHFSIPRVTPEEFFQRLYAESAKRLTPDRPEQGTWISHDEMAEMYGPVERRLRRAIVATPIHLDWRPWIVISRHYGGDLQKAIAQHGVRQVWRELRQRYGTLGALLMGAIRYKLERRVRIPPREKPESAAMVKANWTPGLMLRTWVPWGLLLVPFALGGATWLAAMGAPAWLIGTVGAILGMKLTALVAFYAVQTVRVVGLGLAALGVSIPMRWLARLGGASDGDSARLQGFTRRFTQAFTDWFVPLVVLWQVGGYELSMTMRALQDFIAERPNVEHPASLGAGLVVAALVGVIAWKAGAVALGVGLLAAGAARVIFALRDGDPGRIWGFRWLLVPAFGAALLWTPLPAWVAAHAVAVVGVTFGVVHLLPAVGLWLWGIMAHRPGETSAAARRRLLTADRTTDGWRWGWRQLLDEWPSRFHGLTDILFVVRDSASDPMVLSEPELTWLGALDQKGRWYMGDILVKQMQLTGQRLALSMARFVHHTFYQEEEFPDLIERLMASRDRSWAASALWRLVHDPFVEKWTGMPADPPIIGLRPLVPGDAHDDKLREFMDRDIAPAFNGADGRFVTYMEGTVPGVALPYTVRTEALAPDITAVTLLPKRSYLRFIMQGNPTSLSKGQKLAAMRSWQYQDAGRLDLSSHIDDKGTLWFDVPKGGTGELRYEDLAQRHMAVKIHLDTALASLRGWAGDVAALQHDVLAPAAPRGHNPQPHHWEEKVHDAMMPQQFFTTEEKHPTTKQERLVEPPISAASFKYFIKHSARALDTTEGPREDPRLHPVTPEQLAAHLAAWRRRQAAGAGLEEPLTDPIVYAGEAAQRLLVGLKHHPLAKVLLHVTYDDKGNPQFELIHGFPDTDAAKPYFERLGVPFRWAKGWGHSIAEAGQEPYVVRAHDVIEPLLGLTIEQLGAIVIERYLEDREQRWTTLPFELYVRALSPVQQDTDTVAAAMENPNADVGAAWAPAIADLHRRVEKEDPTFVNQWVEEVRSRIQSEGGKPPDRDTVVRAMAQTRELSAEFKAGRLHLYNTRSLGHRLAAGLWVGAAIGAVAAMAVGPAGWLLGAAAGVLAGWLTRARSADRGSVVGSVSAGGLLALATATFGVAAIFPTGLVLGAVGGAAVAVGVAAAAIYLIQSRGRPGRAVATVGLGYAGFALLGTALFLAPSPWLGGALALGIVAGLWAAGVNRVVPGMWTLAGRNPWLAGGMAGVATWVVSASAPWAAGVALAVLGIGYLLQRVGPPYSRDARIVAALFGRSPRQFAGFWDSSSWRLMVGLPWMEGLGYFRLPLWRRGGGLPAEAPPLTMLEMMTILMVPAQVAPLSAFNVLAMRRAYPIQEALLKAEDTLAGYVAVEEVSRGRRRGASPTGTPLPPAAMIAQQEMQHLSAELKQLDQAINRAGEHGLGVGLKAAHQALFQHPLFTGRNSVHRGRVVTADGHPEAVTVLKVTRQGIVTQLDEQGATTVAIPGGPVLPLRHKGLIEGDMVVLDQFEVRVDDRTLTFWVERDGHVVHSTDPRYLNAWLATPYIFLDNIWGHRVFDILQVMWEPLAYGAPNIPNLISGWTLTNLNFGRVGGTFMPGFSNAWETATLLDPDFAWRARHAMLQERRALVRQVALVGTPDAGDVAQFAEHLIGVLNEGDFDRLRTLLKARLPEDPTFQLQVFQRLRRLQEALAAWDLEVVPVLNQLPDVVRQMQPPARSSEAPQQYVGVDVWWAMAEAEAHVREERVTTLGAVAATPARVLSPVPPALNDAPAVIVILAAGMGTRMGGLQPKAALSVHGKPMARFAVDAARTLGIPAIGVVGSDTEAMRGVFGSDAVLVQQPEGLLGTAAALLAAEAVLRDYHGTVLVALGDMPGVEADTLQMILQAHQKSAAAATDLVARVSDPSGLGRVVRTPDGRWRGEVQTKDFDRLRETGGSATLPDGTTMSADAVAAISEVNTGLYAFRGDGLFAALRRVLNDNPAREFYLPSVLAVLQQQGAEVAVPVVTDDAVVVGVNTPAERLQAETVLAQRTLARPVAAWTTNDWTAALARAATLLQQDAVVRETFVGTETSMDAFLRAVPAMATPWHLLGLSVLAELRDIYGPDLEQVRAEVDRYQRVLGEFEARMGPGPVRLIRAPGRGVLEGSHNDYNGGAELLMTLPVDTLAAVRPRADTQVRMASAHPEFPETMFDIQRELPPVQRGDWSRVLERVGVPAQHWSNYVKGSVLYWQNVYAQEPLRGMDLLVDSTLPMERGISSSSALVVVAGIGFHEVNRKPWTPYQIAEGSGPAEWYVGTRGGNLDHAASLLGRRGQVVRVRPGSPDVTAVPLPEGYRLILADSLVPSDKTGTVLQSFNQRSAESRLFGIALLKQRILAQRPDVSETLAAAPSLGALADVWPQVSDQPLETLVETLPEVVTTDELAREIPQAVDELRRSYQGLQEPAGGWRLRQRVRHVVRELQRVDQAAEALQRGDMAALGAVMDASFHSYRDDYEITVPALSELADVAHGVPGVFGVNLQGGGFGGIMLILTRADAVDSVVDALTTRYYQPKGLERPQVLGSAVFVASPSRGAGVVEARVPRQGQTGLEESAVTHTEPSAVATVVTMATPQTQARMGLDVVAAELKLTEQETETVTVAAVPVSAIVRANPALASAAGQIVRFGDARLVIVPDDPARAADIIVPFMSETKTTVVIRTYGGPEEAALEAFEAQARRAGFQVAPRQPLTGTTLGELLRQILANLSGLGESAVPDVSVRELVEALTLRALA